MADGDTPARQRLRSDLLGWAALRPIVDDGAVAALRDQFAASVASMAPEIRHALQRQGRSRLIISKRRLDHLACDGLAIDAEPFAHTWASVRGILTHAVVDHDWQDRRRSDAGDIAMRVWHEEASRDPGDPNSMSAWMNALTTDDAGILRAQLADLLTAFREVWPLLEPDEVNVTSERLLQVPVADGLVSLWGRPDLMLTSPRRDGYARTLVVDLKTGRPRPETDRAELRFYALLVTLATGVPPFRWATYYVQEGRYDVEDLRMATLEATARRVVASVEQQVRIAGMPSGAVEGLTIRGGGWCRFCTRTSWCPSAAASLATTPEADGAT